MSHFTNHATEIFTRVASGAVSAWNKGFLRAAEAGSVKALQAYLDALQNPDMREVLSGTNVNAANNQGETALVVAARARHGDAIKMLAAVPGVNPNATCERGNTPLMYAVRKSCGHRQEILDVEVVNALLRVPGINVNLANPHHETALIDATFSKNIEALKALAAVPDINPNLQDEFGWTALMHAAQQREVSFIEVLLSVPGTNAELRDYDGKSALDMSARSEGSALIAAHIAAKKANPQPAPAP